MRFPHPRRLRWSVRTGAILAMVVACVVAAGTYAITTALRGDTGPGTLVSVDHLADTDLLGGRAAHVVYRSTAGRGGTSTEVSGTMFVPSGQPPPGGWPVLAFGRDVSSTGDACAPPSPAAVGMTPVVIQYLSRGFAVAYTDYRTPEGDGPHSYLDSRTAGLDIIDSVRALRRTFPDVSTRWAALGVLQGGGAVWEANARAATYAPDLSLVGAVALSPTADMSELVTRAQQDTLSPDQARLLGWTLNALHATKPGLDLSAYRAALAARDGDTAMDCASSAATADDEATTSARPADTVPTGPGDQLRALLAADAVGHDSLSAPLSVVYGSADTTVDPTTIETALRRTCASGGSLSWRRTPGTGRTDNDLTRQIAWITDRFTGVPAASSCAATSVGSAGAGSIVEAVGTPPATALLPRGTRASTILYRSTEGDTGEPTVVSGTVFSPPGTPPPGGWPVVALGHGTTGIDTDCAPSASPTLLDQAVVVATFLSLGFAVTLTDYQGLGHRSPGSAGVHPYLDARTAGLNIIDSVRALRAVFPDISNRWATVGQSQGGAAAWAADEQAGTYAPELTLVGAVAAAPAASVSEIMTKAERGTLTRDQIAAVALIVTSLGRLHPDVDLDRFRRGPAARNWGALTACSASSPDGARATLAQVTVADIAPATPSDTERVTDLLARWALPQRPATAPLSVVYGSADELVDAQWTTDALTRACAMGDTVTIALQQGRGHVGLDLSPQLDWLRDRFAGLPPPDDCP